MNVLFLTTHLNAGGITSYLLTLVRELSRRNVVVHIASSGGNMSEEFLPFAETRVLTLNIRVKSELDIRLYLALWPLVRYIREHHIDVIHAQTRVTQVMGALLSFMTGCAYVSTCHGFFKPRWSRKLFPCWGDYVIAISGAVERHLQDDLNVALKRIVLIGSGVDLKSFSYVGDETKYHIRSQYGFGREPLIGIVARLSLVKGQDLLISAMKRIIESIPEAKLLIAGVGKTEAMLRRLVKNFSLENHVIFLPVFNKTQEILSMLDIFVMPSRQEGLGLSVLEAQAMGLTVIASDVGGIPGLIDHGKTGFLVPTENPEMIADVVIEVLKNPGLLREIGFASRKSVEENHNAQKMADQTLRVYTGLKK